MDVFIYLEVTFNIPLSGNGCLTDRVCRVSRNGKGDKGPVSPPPRSPGTASQRSQGKGRGGGILGLGGPRPFSIVNELVPLLPGTEVPGRKVQQLQLDYGLDGSAAGGMPPEAGS